MKKGPLDLGARAASEWPRLLERRKHERFSLGERVAITAPHSQMIGTLIELSNWGTSLSISSGFVPGVGTEMSLMLRDHKHLWGRVRRTNGAIVALEFLTPVECIQDILRIELRGTEVYSD